ncbi:MAG TPA: endospore germination permease, partial [Clostridia bacterium]|nr:endospore germination permease [Clostridia bacterium]
MNLGKGKISNLQLMFLITSFILGSITFVSFADTITKHDTWLTIISAYAVSIPFILSYVFLSKKFPGKNLIQINDLIYGPYLGKLISLLYIWFILMLLSLNLKGMADFHVGFVTPETPNLLFLIVCSLVSAYAVRKGIESITRISSAIFAVGALFITISFLMLLGNMDFSNFLPLFQMPLKVYFQGVHIVSAIQFCEIMVFFMVMPSLNSYKSIGKYALLGLTIAALLLIIVSIQNTAVLGIASPIYFSDTYQALRMINIGNSLTRMDILFAIGITLVLFVKISVLYYAAVTSTAQLLKMRSFTTLILPIGSIAICLSMILFNSVIEHGLHAKDYHPFLVA